MTEPIELPELKRPLADSAQLVEVRPAAEYAEGSLTTRRGLPGAIVAVIVSRARSAKLATVLSVSGGPSITWSMAAPTVRPLSLVVWTSTPGKFFSSVELRDQRPSPGSITRSAAVLEHT